MTLSRRAALGSAGALAITATLPTQTQALTDEECRVLASMPTATPAQRAWILETFRAARPKLREAFLIVAAMTPAQAEHLLTRIDQERAR